MKKNLFEEVDKELAGLISRSNVLIGEVNRLRSLCDKNGIEWR